MSDICVAYYSGFLVYPNLLLPIVRGLSAVSLLPFIFIFIRAFVQKKLKSWTNLFVLSLIYFFTICAYYVLAILYNQFWCQGNFHLAFIFGTITSSCYGIQAVCLMLNLFLRLTLIFRDAGTDLALSKYTQIVFVALSISGILLYMVGTIAVFSGASVYFYALLATISAAAYVIGVIWLNALFAYKLVKVHKETTKGHNGTVIDGTMIYLVVKSAVLCFVSTLSVVSYVAMFMLDTIGLIQSPHLRFVIFGFFLLCDLHTNFFSILFTFKYFDVWYKKLCGCCHVCCHQMCTRCAGVQTGFDDITMLCASIELQTRTTSQSRARSGSSPSSPSSIAPSGV